MSHRAFHAQGHTKGARKNVRSAPVFVGMRRVSITSAVAHQRGGAGQHFWTVSASLPFITAEKEPARWLESRIAALRNTETGANSRQHASPMKPCVPSLRAACAHRLWPRGCAHIPAGCSHTPTFSVTFMKTRRMKRNIPEITVKAPTSSTSNDLNCAA